MAEKPQEREHVARYVPPALRLLGSVTELTNTLHKTSITETITVKEP